MQNSMSILNVALISTSVTVAQIPAMLVVADLGCLGFSGQIEIPCVGTQ